MYSNASMHRQVVNVRIEKPDKVCVYCTCLDKTQAVLIIKVLQLNLLEILFCWRQVKS